MRWRRGFLGVNPSVRYPEKILGWTVRDDRSTGDEPTFPWVHTLISESRIVHIRFSYCFLSKPLSKLTNISLRFLGSLNLTLLAWVTIFARIPGLFNIDETPLNLDDDTTDIWNCSKIEPSVDILGDLIPVKRRDKIKRGLQFTPNLCKVRFRDRRSCVIHMGGRTQTMMTSYEIWRDNEAVKFGDRSPSFFPSRVASLGRIYAP